MASKRVAPKREAKKARPERGPAKDRIVNSRGEVIGENDSEVDKLNQTPDANQEAVGQTIAGPTQ